MPPLERAQASLAAIEARTDLSARPVEPATGAAKENESQNASESRFLAQRLAELGTQGAS